MSSNINENSQLINENSVIDSIDFNDIVVLEEKLKEVYLNYNIHQKKFLNVALNAGLILNNLLKIHMNGKKYKKVGEKSFQKSLDDCDVKWSKRYCYFLIGLHIFASEYPKIKKVSLNISEIKEKFCLIKKEFNKSENNDKIQFWKEN